MHFRREILPCHVTHLVPALDHHALAQSELERVVAIQGGVELLTVGGQSALRTAVR